MRPDKLSITELFQKERRYVVPLYQRAYVWSREAQWEPLWDDIERQTEASLDGSRGRKPRSHFLGAIVLNVSKTHGRSVPWSEVIDGQQRLTTLQLFVASLRDYAAEIGSRSTQRLQDLTINPYQKPGSDEALKVWPTNADRTLFKAILNAGSPDALWKALKISRAEDAPRLAGAYLYFADRIRDFCGEDNADKDVIDDRIAAIVDALRSTLQVVVIELEDGDDPQVIFETLNARGQPLLPSDLIRNYIFMDAAGDPEVDSDALYDRYWRPFDDQRVATSLKGENRFWHIEERQGRLTRPRIDLFLYHYLVMQTEHELNIGQLFREFREWQESRDASTEELLADLKAYGELFAQLIEPTGDDRVATLARRLRALDNSTVYPLLMHVMSLPTERLPLAARDQILEDIESWLVRRFVCALTNKNYNRFFPALLGKLKQAEVGADLSEIVRTELTRSSDVTLAWPGDEQFLAAWLSKPLYAKSRPDRSAMVLRAIERSTRSARNEAVTLPDFLSVEHLLPQKGSLENYPFGDVGPLASGDTLGRRRERLRDTIGNLTLLTTELNSSVSNGPFPDKVTKIRLDSDLRLNAWLRAVPEPTEWSEIDILERGQRLFESAKMLWPRPAFGEIWQDDDQGEPEAKSGWQFTDAALLNAKRRAILAALSRRENVVFKAETISKHGTADGQVRAVMAVSKRYEDRGANPYWYAYHPVWDEYLAAASHSSWVLLGCMDRSEAYALPRSVLFENLDALNVTTLKDGKMYWHVHLGERDGEPVLLLPRRGDFLPLGSYVLALDDAGA